MEVLIPILVFIFGTIIGSFLNVVIFRMNTGMGIGGRSKCLSCGKELAWYELIPLFSYIFQGGKCRKCKSNFSIQYPLIEAITGVVFLGIYTMLLPMLYVNSMVFVLFAVLYALIWSVLIVIAGYDQRHSIIPNGCVYTFILLSLIASVIARGFDPRILVAGVSLAAPFAALWLFSRGKLMGFGDAKLALGIGFFLGLSQGVAAIALGFWIGAVYAVILLLANRNKTMKSEVPFGPFLIIGTFISFLWNVDVASILSVFMW